MYDLVVVGAGPVGTTLAILAAQRGFDTVLIDTRPVDAGPQNDGRTFAIVRGSWRLIGAAGVHADLVGQTEPLNGLEAMDGGRHFFGAPAVAFGGEDLPGATQEPLGQMVPAENLQAALDAAAARTPGLTWQRGTRFTALTSHTAFADVTLLSGAHVRTRLVAACDGVASAVRGAVGIGVEGRAYGKSVFAATVKLERPHGGIARQMFSAEGPFATLPMRDNEANLAWYMKTGAAEALAKLPRAAQDAELNYRFAAFAGAMKIVSPPIAYPLKMQVAQRMIGPRTALLGDAAHRINPLAGQGLNLGFKDVGALIDVMLEARRLGLDPGSEPALGEYSQARRFDGVATALFMDGIDRAFSNRSAVLKPLRGAAMGLAQNFSPLRRLMAAQASADQQHLPSLMRA